MGNLISEPVTIAVFREEAKDVIVTAVDDDGNPIDQTGQIAAENLKFVVETLSSTPTVVFEFDSSTAGGRQGDWLLSGAGNNVLTISLIATDTADPIVGGTYKYRCWNTNSNRVLGHGAFTIIETSE